MDDNDITFDDAYSWLNVFDSPSSYLRDSIVKLIQEMNEALTAGEKSKAIYYLNMVMDVGKSLAAGDDSALEMAEINVECGRALFACIAAQPVDQSRGDWHLCGFDLYSHKVRPPAKGPQIAQNHSAGDVPLGGNIIAAGSHTPGRYQSQRSLTACFLDVGRGLGLFRNNLYLALYSPRA